MRAHAVVVPPPGFDHDLGLGQAESGKAAIAACSHTRFDVILLDLNMPRMHGTEVASRLRDQRGPNSETPIVTCTAKADLDRSQLRAAGLNGCLIKPFRARDLVDVVSQSLGALHDSEAAPSRAASFAP